MPFFRIIESLFIFIFSSYLIVLMSILILK
nr:MAG TPA: hypothetical protein [Caudoviricetes sp.]